MLTLLLTLACKDGGDSADGGALTLDNCTTETDGAGDFFADLFSCVEASASGGQTTVHTTGLPPHLTFYYGVESPNYTAWDESRGDEYSPNPNTISEQDVTFTIPDEPQLRGITVDSDLVDGVVGTSEDEYPMGAAGVALDSVLIANPLAGPGDDIEEEKYTFDEWNGHPQQEGTYHLHATMPGPLTALQARRFTDTAVPGEGAVEIYGIMCDGTVILGCNEADGSAVSGELDAQGGHFGDIEGADGQLWFSDRYHTHVCEGGREFTPEVMVYDACEIEGGGVGGPP